MNQLNNHIAGIGCVTLNDIGKVLYIPKLTLGLISIPALDKRGYTTTFGCGIAVIQNSANVIILTGRIREHYIELL